MKDSKKNKNQFDPLETALREGKVYSLGLNGEYKKTPVLIIGFLLIGSLLFTFGIFFIIQIFQLYSESEKDIASIIAHLMLFFIAIGIIFLGTKMCLNALINKKKCQKKGSQMQLKQAKDRKLSIFALSCLISFIFFNIAYCEEKINSYEVFGLRKAKTGKLTEAKANLLKAAQQNKDPQNSTAKKLADTIDDAKNNKINRKTAILILSGQDAANKGQTEKAIADFKAAIAKDPNYPQTYYYLGKLYLSMDNKAAALDAFKSCLKFAPKDSMLAKETEKIIADLENKKEEE